MTFENILKSKIEYYGNTLAAYEFAGEEIENQLLCKLDSANKRIKELENINKGLKDANHRH